jgi:hypothetical protein
MSKVKDEFFRTNAELRAEIESFLGPSPKKKPKVVASDGVVVRDADVPVSLKDPNSRPGRATTVHVRRADYVTVDMVTAERRYWENVNAQAERRRLIKQADPYNQGHWGRIDD